MVKVNRINVSQIEGGYSDDSDKRPNGEIALYNDDNGGFDLVIHDGVNSTNLNKVLGKGKLYGHGADSADGNGYDTIKLIPDIPSYNSGSHQYIIVDPTGPNHVHLRAGGPIDNSSSELIIGGENSYVKIGSGANPPVYISSNDYSWIFNTSGLLELAASGLQFSDGTIQNTAASGIINETLSTSLIAGSGIILNYDEIADTLTIASSGGGSASNPFDQDLNTFNSPTFDQISISGYKITGGGTNSGDGNGYGTLELIPDSGLYSNNQYIIIDPTGPNHVHLRAGGTIDNSLSELIVGGENSNVKIGAGSNPNITIRTTASNSVEFVGQIDNGFGDGPGATLHVTSITNGTITDGMTIYGEGLPPEGWVLQFGTVMAPQGDGGTGNYYLPGANYLIGSQSFNNGGSSSNNTWTFATNGDLQFPSQLSVSPLSNFVPASGTAIQQASGQILDILSVGDGGFTAVGWVENTFGPGNVASISFNEIPGEVRISTGAFGGVVNTWIYDADGDLTIPSGIIFSDSSIQTTAWTGSISSSQVSDFNSAVSGLLPVKDIVSGTNISVTSVSGVYTVNSTVTSVDQAASIVTTVFNETGSQIPKMTAVYIDGGHGDRPTVSLALATGDPTSAGTYGVTFENIDNMQLGQVIVFGALTGVNTDPAHGGIAGAIEGSTLYLSPTTPGGLTTTKPSAPNHIVAIGTVVRVHQNEGVIEVRIQNGFELDELHNVAISGATNGQFLQYNSSSQLWVPSSSGNFSTLQVSGTNVSVSGHAHTSSDITDFNSSVSGLLPTIANSGDNRILTSTGTSTGINGEANLTFDGSLLSVSGSGLYTSGLNLGASATNGIISGLSTTNTVPALRFQSITANHSNTSHVIFDWYKNTSTRLFYIDGSGNFYADSNNGNFIASNTSPSSNNGTYIGHGMRRHTNANGFDFAWGESIVSTTEPGIDLYPIGGTHITNGILLRLSKNSSKTDVAMLVNGNGFMGLGTTNPTSRLHVIGTTTISGSLDIDNLTLDGNTVSSTNTNGNIILSPNGSGKVGIANSSPSYTLDVTGGGKFSQLYPTVVAGSIVSSAVDTDVSAGQIFDITLTENITLNNPTNPVNGVTIRWRIAQDNTGGYSVTLGDKFVIPSSATNPLPWSTAANAMDVLAATYHAGRDKWDIVAFVPGY